MRKLKDSRRPEILDAARALAGERGGARGGQRAGAPPRGLTPMALYGYFRSKDDLFDALLGRLLTEVPRPAADLEWREIVRQLAAGVRAVASRHPSVFPLLFTRPAVSPTVVAIIDVLYQALLAAGVPTSQVPRLERLISTFLLGHAVSEVSGRFAEGSLDTRSRRAQLPPEALPGHQRVAEFLDCPVDWEQEFEVDLEEILDMVQRSADRG